MVPREPAKKTEERVINIDDIKDKVEAFKLENCRQNNLDNTFREEDVMSMLDLLTDTGMLIFKRFLKNGYMMTSFQSDDVMITLLQSLKNDPFKSLVRRHGLSRDWQKKTEKLHIGRLLARHSQILT